MFFLLLLTTAVVAVAAAGGGAPKRVAGPELEAEAASATGARTIDTCATGYSWKGKSPGWLGQAFDAAAAAASAIPLPAVATGVAAALGIVKGVLQKLKVGGKRSATVNPNSEDGKGRAVNLGSWKGVRNVEVTAFVQARRLDHENLWYLFFGSDNESWCADMQGASQLSTVIAAWRTSGRLAATGELPPMKIDAEGEGRFGDVVFPDGVKDAVPPKLAKYYRSAKGAGYPMSERWSGPFAGWVYPPTDELIVGVVRVEGTDDFQLWAWIPPRIGALRWTFFWKVGEA